MISEIKALNSLLQKSSEEPPFFSSVIVVSPDKKHLLLAKRKDGKGWTMPGGGANPGETPKAAAVRETFEEANIFLTEETLAELHIAPVFGDRFCHVFLAILTMMQEPGVQNDPDKEVRSWIWHPISDPLPEPMSEARKNSCLKALFELARQRTESEFLDAMERHEIFMMEKSFEKPVGSVSTSGKYKKVGSGDWRKIGGHGDPSPNKPGVDKTPSDKPLHNVDVKFKHQGKEYSHTFSVPAQSPDQAWSLVEGQIKTLESKIGAVEMVSRSVKPVKVEKSLAENEMTGTNIDTTHQATEDLATQNSYWLPIIKETFSDMALGAEPRSMNLDFPWELQAFQVDQGIYDGHVKNRDEQSGNSGEVVFQIKKMTLPAMVEALKAKEFIKEPPPPVDSGPQETMDAHGLLELTQVFRSIFAQLMQTSSVTNINFYKSEELTNLNTALKGLL